MNYTYTENLPPNGGSVDSVGLELDKNSHWTTAFNSYDNIDSNSKPCKLTSENLILNFKEGCNFIEDHNLNQDAKLGINNADSLITNYEQINSQQQNLADVGLTKDFGTHSNIHDNSSAPTILNQQTKNFTQTINQFSIQDEEKLTEKEITNRRKAQNRAAQRAFRERKEMKLKELEEKLNKSENDKNILLKQLEELKKQNIVISTENKLLLENGNNLPVGVDSATLAQEVNTTFQFPSRKNFHNASYSLKSSNDLTNPDIPYDQKRLTITGTWEYLNEIVDSDNLDIDAIMDTIRGLEVCHEHGPAYPLKTIDAIIKKFSLNK